MMFRYVAGFLIAGILACQPVVAAETPSGAVYTTAPFSNARYFASVMCITKKFNCADTLTDEQYLAIANACANETLGFAPTLLGTYSSRGQYKNCALPTSYQAADQSKSGKNQWPICCIVPKGDSCTFQCHSYYAD